MVGLIDKVSYRADVQWSSKLSSLLERVMSRKMKTKDQINLIWQKNSMETRIITSNKNVDISKQADKRVVNNYSSCYRQLSADIKIKYYESNTNFINPKGMHFYFNIRGKLSIIRCFT